MTILDMILLAFGVSVDAFSVSVSRSIVCHKMVWKNAASAAFFFGGFQFIMPILGGWISSFIGPFLYSVDHYIAFTLLALVGGKMILESIRENKDSVQEIEQNKDNLFNCKALFILGIATSIDAMAVGASIILSGNNFMKILLPASILMGLVTGVLSFIGVLTGKLAGKLLNFKMELIGGAVIVLIGIKILIEHVVAGK